jgi:ParB/RepB/Spo0J family partition protein
LDTPTHLPSPRAGSAPTSTPSALTSCSPSTPTPPSQSITTSQPTSPQTLHQIPLDQIDLHHQTNHRLDPDPDAIRRLAANIAANGLINPITVTPNGARYHLIAGYHRLRAHQHLGLPTITATVVNADDTKAASLRLAENLARTNLSPLEEACQLNDLVQTHPAGVDGVAALTARSTSWILDRLELLSWHPELQRATHERKISLAVAKRLARLPTEQALLYYLQHALTHGINARTAALWLQDANRATLDQPPASEKSAQNPTNETQQPTLVHCFACGQPTQIIDTLPLRFCHPCATALQREFHAQPRIDQPA